MLIKKLSKVGLSLLMTASFSISAFAGYDFSEDGNTNNTSYNGTNDVYSNGIYVGTDPVTGLPIYKFEMDNQNNTYNGTTNIHGNGDALFDGYDTNGTYTGTVDIVGTDVGPGTTTTISNANINAVTSISAADSIADNDLNAGVLIQDSTFTNDVTIQSSTVNLSSDANVILGSSSQMDSLLSKTDTSNTHLNNIYARLNTTNTWLSNLKTNSDTIIARLNTIIQWFSNYFINQFDQIERTIKIVADNMGKFRSTTDANNITVNLGNTSRGTAISYDLNEFYTYEYTVNSDGSITPVNTSVYTNYIGFFYWNLNNMIHLLRSGFTWINQFMIGQGNYSIYTFTAQDQYYSLTTATQNTTWRAALINRLTTIINLLNYYCTRFFEWYYPLDSTAPMYWRTYNSDTDQMESVNIARVLYDISWYLGHITIGDDIADDVQSLSDNLTSYQQAEQTLQNRVSSSIQNFVPDVNMFSGLKAISFVRTWLQNIYLALGAYGSVMMVGLLLGVCMQFIGYFRYKF